MAGVCDLSGGVVVFTNGIIQGGDGFHIYFGEYTSFGELVHGNITVHCVASNLLRSLCLLDAGDWEFQGTITGNLIRALVTSTRDPEDAVTVEFTKRAPLPGLTMASLPN
jgi:hypothetical protein